MEGGSEDVTKLMLVMMMMIMMTFIPENCPALINLGCFLGDRAVELMACPYLP